MLVHFHCIGKNIHNEPDLFKWVSTDTHVYLVKMACWYSSESKWGRDDGVKVTLKVVWLLLDDAFNIALHFIRQYMDCLGTYARILFVKFSFVLNSILPDLLQGNLFQMSMPDPMFRWITNFLMDRKQHVEMGKNVSDSWTICTSSPQDCVLSPMLFALYTNSCPSNTSLSS